MSGAPCSSAVDQEEEQEVGGLRISPGDGDGTCRVTAAGIPDREYRGSLEITVEKGVLRVVNRLPLADYLAGVIGSEGGAGAPPEALKAQAVLARTFARRHRGRHGAADFCDTTHCQLYQGRAFATPGVEEAVRATAGEILTWQGAPARAFYHSTCGGTTRPFADTWGRPGPPYLEGWPTATPAGNLPISAGSSGSATRSAWSCCGRCPAGNRSRWRWRRPVPAAGSAGWRCGSRMALARRLRGEEFHSRAGRRLGWNAIRSACFTVRREGETWIFEGRGFGHGVGLCQWGAAGLARRGWDHARILAFYFPGTNLRRD